MDSNTTLPGVGQTWLADLGPDTPLGHFTVEITFDSATQVSFEVTGGAIKGRKQTMEYTTTRLRDGLHVVRCMASSVIGGEFVQLHGERTRVR